MPTTIVAGNWKMHGDIALAKTLLSAVATASEQLDHIELSVLPPAVFMPLAEQVLQNTSATWGGQNIYFEEQGAFTGEIAAPMLTAFQAKYVLVGHSERRQLFQEKDAVVAKKFKLAVANQLHPILCVGETLSEYQGQQTEKVILRQLDAVLSLVGIGAFAKAVIAYEPVWAIGTGHSATPEQAQQVHASIRQHLAKHDLAIAESVAILYGGSVKPANAGELLAMPDINGGLIGGASLKADDFIAIARIANEQVNT